MGTSLFPARTNTVIDIPVDLVKHHPYRTGIKPFAVRHIVYQVLIVIDYITRNFLSAMLVIRIHQHVIYRFGRQRYIYTLMCDDILQVGQEIERRRILKNFNLYPWILQKICV